MRMNSLKSRAIALRAVIAEDSRLGARMFFQAALEDDLDLGLRHGLAQLEVHDRARATIQDRAEIEEGT
jgi:hypothetical protein